MKLKLLAITLLAATTLFACNSENSNNVEATTVHNNEDIKELVNDYSLRKIKDVNASITSTQLITTDSNGKEEIIDLPEDEFFVSIAPYINKTHPCTNHSLTGCQGEMVNKEFDIKIIDTEGNVIVDKKMQTLENGFIDLWLPRNQTYEITIEHEGKKVNSTFSTFEYDGTCITTLQLI